MKHSAHAAGLQRCIGRLFGGSELRLTLAGDYVWQRPAPGEQRAAEAGRGRRTGQPGRLESKGTLEVSAARIENTAGGQFNATAGNGSGRVALSTAGDFSNAGRVDGDTVEVSAANITNTGTVMGNALELRARASPTAATWATRWSHAITTKG
jgi:filamentous hemagglutinin